MNYLNITKYAYLAVGIIMMYDAYTEWSSKSDELWLRFILGAVAIFMFFFRNNFAKKFANRNKNNNQSQS